MKSKLVFVPVLVVVIALIIMASSSTSSTADKVERSFSVSDAALELDW